MASYINIERIYIEDLKSELGVDDLRAVRAWCKTYNVGLFRDKGCKKYYAFKLEFYAAKSKEGIEYFSKKYGIENLPEAYQAHMNVFANHRQNKEDGNGKNKMCPVKNQEAIDHEKLSFVKFLKLNTRATICPMSKKPLYIPKSKRIRGLGLGVLCSNCRSLRSETCGESGEHLTKCKHGEDHQFKAFVYVKKGNNKRMTKLFSTRNVEDAIRQTLDFRANIKEGNVETTNKIRKEVETEPKTAPILLMNLIEEYIKFLNNDKGIVPTFRVKQRTKGHITDVTRNLKVLAQCVIDHGEDITKYKVTDIDDHIVGKVVDYADEKKYSSRTFNKTIGILSTFLTYCSEEHQIQVKNWFDRVTKRKIIVEPKAMTSEVFSRLLEQVTYSNGIDHSKGSNHSIYSDFLKPGFRLLLETGRRAPEVAGITFKDIMQDEHGNPHYIKVPDKKVNNIMHITDQAQMKYIYIPITLGLHDLLMEELGYDENKNNPNNPYILAPEITENRQEKVVNAMSKAFSFYIKQLPIGQELTLRSLRKAYITQAALHMGGNAQVISQHSGFNVAERFYIDKLEIIKAAKGFQIFPKQETIRKDELEQVREKDKTNEKDIQK